MFILFKECPVSPVPYKTTPEINNCLKLVAFVKSQGQNVAEWCSIANNYKQCCITCQSNYLKYNSVIKNVFYNYWMNLYSKFDIVKFDIKYQNIIKNEKFQFFWLLSLNFRFEWKIKAHLKVHIMFRLIL